MPGAGGVANFPYQAVDYIVSIFDWFSSHPDVVRKIVLGSVLIAIGYAIVIFIAIARMSPDYFARKSPTAGTWRSRHPALRLLIHVTKTVFGALFIVMGIAMLVLPGQGVLTILIGVSLLDFPGKKRLERSIVGRPSVFGAINSIRRRAGQPPLIMPDGVE